MWGKKKNTEIEFDEILMDASNLPSFDQRRLEGQRELPITSRNIFFVGGLFSLVALVFWWQLVSLQVIHGAEYRAQSDSNRIDQAVIIAERGVVYDRTGEMLAWNEEDYEDEHDFPVRAYTDRLGLGQLIGYVSYPQRDSKGFYYRTDYIGRNGVESAFEDILHGTNGRLLFEVNATDEVISQHAVEPSVSGREVRLSIDAGLSEAMYEIISTSSAQAGFRSGAGAIMDVHTGEIIAMTSFPSYDPEVMADGDDVELIASYNADERFPFLNKVVAGAYTPGSIV
ncbi:MAG: penicillin-binding transpeptidase domain-containing protein, partial [Bacteroidota bacterium]